MARYPLNLPATLKEEAEQYAARQGVSLNQFILWAVSEKVGLLKQELDDPVPPDHLSARRGRHARTGVTRLRHPRAHPGDGSERMGAET